MCLRELSFTALQQGDIYDLLRVSFPCADQSSHYQTSPPLFCTLHLSPSLFLTFSVLVANPEKTILHSGQSRSSWSVEHGNVYSSVYAIPVAYSFLHVTGMYVWSTLSVEYDMDQPGVVASPARGHLKK